MRRGGGGARILASHLFFPLSRFFLGSEKAGAGGGGINSGGNRGCVHGWVGGLMASCQISTSDYIGGCDKRVRL